METSITRIVDPGLMRVLDKRSQDQDSASKRRRPSPSPKDANEPEQEPDKDTPKHELDDLA
jgi:hypothetical protein